MTKYGIIGSRMRLDRQSVTDFVNCLPENSVVVSGGCIGIDTWAADAAMERGLAVVVHLPDKSGCTQRWQFTKAFHARNELIAQDCDVLVAFVSSDRKGGTEDTIRRAKKHGKEIWIK